MATTSPSEYYTAASKSDELLRQQQQEIVTALHVGAISQRQAADLRVAALERHLSDLALLRVTLLDVA